MRYWITTHWPRREDKHVDEPHHLWVQDKKRKIIDRVKPGDLAFIYECKSGPITVLSYADGSTSSIRRGQGREGIIALVQVTEPPHEPEDTEPERYSDGTKSWWRYCAPTRSVNSAGFIPRVRAASILGYDETYVFRGFGQGHSGLKEIREEVFKKILAAFADSAQQDEQECVARAPQAKFGGGGEGADHLALKQRIAADPAGVLGEPGLKLWKMEWPFPTGDKIDVVLKDQYGRFVAVEVEVNCDASEMAGPLQCMKYRAMLSYFFDRPVEEVRCILVAHSVHQKVRDRCELHLINTKVVAIA